MTRLSLCGCMADGRPRAGEIALRPGTSMFDQRLVRTELLAPPTLAGSVATIHQYYHRSRAYLVLSRLLSGLKRTHV